MFGYCMPYGNEVILRVQNLPSRCCQPLKLLMYIGRGFRSFNAVNIGSQGQKATKLLAFKVGGLKKKSAAWPDPAQTSWPMFNSGRI